MKEPAFPLVVPTSTDKATGAVLSNEIYLGLTVSDYFAASLADPREYAMNLSREAQETLAGPAPVAPRMATSDSPVLASYHIRLLHWELRLHAKIHYLHAETMLLEKDT